jgi:hypothetical protein
VKEANVEIDASASKRPGILNPADTVVDMPIVDDSNRGKVRT